MALGVSVCSGVAGSLCWGALLWEELKQSSDARAGVHSGVGLVPMGGSHLQAAPRSVSGALLCEGAVRELYGWGGCFAGLCL